MATPSEEKDDGEDYVQGPLGEPVKVPHKGQWMLPLDWRMLDTLQCRKQRAPMSKCRFVMSIFRQENKADGGWGSFVWYAAKLEKNLTLLTQKWPRWRTRVYLDDSVPPSFVRHLIRAYNVEVVVVKHLRKGPARDYLIPTCRTLVLDDPTLDRFCSLDCHDELKDVLVQELLTKVYTNHRARPQVHWTYWDVDTHDGHMEGKFCWLNACYYGEGPDSDWAHRHIDAGCWGFIGGRDMWWPTQGYIMQALTALVKNRRVTPGHEEAFIDVIFGDLLRARKPYVGCKKVITGCTPKMDAQPVTLITWLERHNVDAGGRWPKHTYLRDITVNAFDAPTEVDLTCLGVGRDQCPLTAAYMGMCFGWNTLQARRARERERIIGEAPSSASSDQTASTCPSPPPSPCHSTISSCSSKTIESSCSSCSVSSIDTINSSQASSSGSIASSKRSKRSQTSTHAHHTHDDSHDPTSGLDVDVYPHEHVMDGVHWSDQEADEGDEPCEVVVSTPLSSPSLRPSTPWSPEPDDSPVRPSSHPPLEDDPFSLDDPFLDAREPSSSAVGELIEGGLEEFKLGHEASSCEAHGQQQPQLEEGGKDDMCDQETEGHGTNNANMTDNQKDTAGAGGGGVGVCDVRKEGAWLCEQAASLPPPPPTSVFDFSEDPLDDDEFQVLKMHRSCMGSRKGKPARQGTSSRQQKTAEAGAHAAAAKCGGGSAAARDGRGLGGGGQPDERKGDRVTTKPTEGVWSKCKRTLTSMLTRRGPTASPGDSYNHRPFRWVYLHRKPINMAPCKMVDASSARDEGPPLDTSHSMDVHMQEDADVPSKGEQADEEGRKGEGEPKEGEGGTGSGWEDDDDSIASSSSEKSMPQKKQRVEASDGLVDGCMKASAGASTTTGTASTIGIHPGSNNSNVSSSNNKGSTRSTARCAPASRRGSHHGNSDKPASSLTPISATSPTTRPPPQLEQSQSRRHWPGT